MKNLGMINSLAIFRFVFTIIIPLNLNAEFSRERVITQNFKIYLPLIRNGYPFETNIPACRWSTYSLVYKWGVNLQNPGTNWRNAFESAVVDWNIAPVKFYFYYSSTGNVAFDTYFMQDNNQGYAVWHCNDTVTTGYEAYGNTFYSHTLNGYHAAAGHETGHTQSIGHVGDPTVIALMGNNPNSEIYFTPQQADINFVNIIYP